MQIIKETTIPFSGFYESIHTDRIDREFEYFFDNNGDGEIDIPEEKQSDFWTEYDPVGWGILKEYSKAYVEFVANEFDLSLVFDELTSPREYNFQTDRIFAKLPMSEVNQMMEKTDKKILEQLIEEKFTRRSGFIPFYSNDLETWLKKPLADWDHNEIGTLLEAYLMTLNESNDEIKLYERMEIYADIDTFSIISDCMPTEFYEKYEIKETN